MLKFFQKKKNQGVVSIFLLIVLLPTMIFSSLLMEIGRYYNAKNLLDEAAQNAATSILASYNKKLYEEFGLYAFDEQDTEKLKKNFISYLKANCNLEDMPVEEGYSMAASRLVELTDNINIETMYNLRESNVLIRQIEEYSKYRAPVALMNDVLNIDKLKEDLLKKIGQTVFGESAYKIVETSLKSIEFFVDLAKELKDMFLAVRDLEGSVEGANFGEEITLLIARLKAEFNDKTYEKKSYEDGLNFSTAKEHLEEAIEKREKYIKELNEIKQIQIDLINLAEGIKNYYEVNPGESIIQDGMKKFNELFENFSKMQYSGITPENTLQDYLEMIKNEKYKFNIGAEEELSLDIIETIINDKEKILGKKDDKIDELNEDVNEAQKQYVKSLKEISKYFEPYITQVGKLQDSIVSYQTSADEATTEKTKEFVEKINQFLVGGVNKIRENGENGKKFCEEEAERIEEISYLNIQKSDLQDISKQEIKGYYLGYEEAENLVKYANAFKIKDVIGDSPIMKLINGIKKLGNVMRIDPYLYSNERQTTLSAQTLELFNYSQTQTPSAVSDDSKKLDEFFEDAKNNVPSQYYNDIDTLAKNKEGENDTLYNTIISRIDATATAIYNLCGGNESGGFALTVMDVNSGAISVAIRIVQHIKDICTVMENLVWFASQMTKNAGLIAEALEKSLRTKLLTAYYIREKMTTRLDKTRINPYDDAQVFVSSNYEYVLVGSASEKENQKKIFWDIFIIRLVMNIIAVLTSKEGEAILGIPIVGVIVVIAWIYYETNIDMNLLLRVGTSVPLVKLNPFISIENLENVGETLEKLVEDIDKMDTGDKSKEGDESEENKKNQKEEKKNQLLGESDDTIFDWKYEDYLLLFTLLTPESKLITNVGNVIQMEMRYTQRKSGKQATFLLHKANTYIRSEVTARLNPLLPLRSLSKEYDMSVFGLREVHYNGY